MAHSRDVNACIRDRSIARQVGSAALLLAVLAWGCSPETPAPTPPISPGSGAQPRDVNLIARDWSFEPATVPLVPGETITLHVVNAGLETHEAIIGDATVQDAWEVAEAAASPAPPGATPAVSVPPETAGVRVVVGSGERVDLTWTVPADPALVEALIIGCHIPGHWEKGMRAEVAVPS
jgi:uncharacterized cupredoxin-like copper-binding protein